MLASSAFPPRSQHGITGWQQFVYLTTLNGEFPVGNLDHFHKEDAVLDLLVSSLIVCGISTGLVLSVSPLTVNHSSEWMNK